MIKRRLKLNFVSIMISALTLTSFGQSAPSVTSLTNPGPGTMISMAPPLGGFKINGTGFGNATGTVKLGNLTLTVNSWADTFIYVQIPTGTSPTTGNIVVTTSASQSSNAVSFTVTAPFGCS